MKISEADFVKAMQYLGVQRSEFIAVDQAAPEARRALLDSLKERIRKQFKRVALDLHPDRTNNDPVKTEDFKLVSSVVDAIDKLGVSPPRPPPVPFHKGYRVVFVTYGFSTTATYTTTATSAGWTNGNGF